MRNWFIGIEEDTRIEHLRQIAELQKTNDEFVSKVTNLTEQLNAFSASLDEVSETLRSLANRITVQEAPTGNGVYARGNEAWHEIIVDENNELSMHSSVPILEDRYYTGKGNDEIKIAISGIRCTLNNLVQPPVRSITWSADNLPTGLTINSRTGEITGKVQSSGTEGAEVNTTIHCKNEYGTGNCRVGFVISPAPNLIARSFTKTTNDEINESIDGSYITIGNGVTEIRWKAENVPEGLTFSNGKFVGTPRTNFSGVTIVTVETNGGTASTNVEWNIIAAPSLSGRTVTATTADNINVTIVSKNTTEGVSGVANVQWEVSNIPLGLSFKNGTFSGRPTAENSSISVVTVTTNAGIASANITWNITFAKPAINSRRITKRIGEEVSETVTGDNIILGANSITSVSWSIENVPPGLEFNNGIFTGIPTEPYDGTSVLVVTTNGGTAQGIIDWDIA